MSQNNAADRLIERILQFQNPSVVGLDPVVGQIPAAYGLQTKDDSMVAVAAAFEAWGRDVIDAVWDIVPAVKPQTAFYEAYGYAGMRAFARTIAYAKARGLIVIEDAKRGDIGNTAAAYAAGHLGRVAGLDGEDHPSYDVDFLTVSPFLGSDSLKPFIETAIAMGKGLFILVRTSNGGAGEVQDAEIPDGRTVSEMLADLVAAQGARCVGAHGYSSIGAVVGATYPEDAIHLRARMPKSLFLIPGYGAQGAAAADAVVALDPKGLGGVINSSRGVLYHHTSESERQTISRSDYQARVRAAAIAMRQEIQRALLLRRS